MKKKIQDSIPQIPETGFLRLKQIVGDQEKGIPAIIPVSKSTWWSGVKSGRYPKSVKLSDRCTAWRKADVMAIGNVDV